MARLLSSSASGHGWQDALEHKVPEAAGGVDLRQPVPQSLAFKAFFFLELPAKAGVRLLIRQDNVLGDCQSCLNQLLCFVLRQLAQTCKHHTLEDCGLSRLSFASWSCPSFVNLPPAGSFGQCKFFYLMTRCQLGTPCKGLQHRET